MHAAYATVHTKRNVVHVVLWNCEISGDIPEIPWWG